MNRKRIALLFGMIVIGAWGLVFVLLFTRFPADDPAVLPTLASLPTTAQAILANGEAAEIVPDAVPNQVVIQFAPDVGDDEQADYVAVVGGEIVASIPALNAVVLNIPGSAIALEPSPLVIASEPDYYVSALIEAPTSDTYYDQQWGLEVIGAPQAWSTLPPEATPYTVAVIDSGICASHPDLNGRIGTGYDFVEDDPTPQDEAGHGCAVSGVIAANIDNGLGIAGVAPNAQIMPLRVLDAQGIGTYSDVAAAMVYAVDQGASIINLSLGGPNASSLLANAVNYAANQDVMVVAAAGNTSIAGVLYPAAYESVVAVGAVDATLQRSSFSTYGPEIDALAPGRDILTTRNDGDYDLFSGTSLAAPHVTGMAVLEMARGNTLSLDGGLVTLGDAAQPPTPQPVSIPPEYDDLYDKAVTDGQLRLIVGINAPFQAQALQNAAQAQAQQATITQVRQTLVDQLSAISGAIVMPRSQDWIAPYLAVKADAAALAFLANSPDVVSIQEDKLSFLSLARSTPHIDANDAWSLGYDGSGQTVAILDGGTEASHDFFGGRVIEEACFSNFWETDTSLCPNNQVEQFGPGAASPARCALFYSGCDHGTHVAGIAAGGNGVAQAPSGVAKGANIIAIQVFTWVSDCSTLPGAQPCHGSWTIDQIQGLFRVYELRNTYDIAAANMSLGGATYDSVATCDADNDFIKTYIDALRLEDIATIAASGNEYVTDGIGAPACISSAISVGSVGTAFSTGPMTDVVSSFSNSASILDLLAPGGYIYSASTGNSYAWNAGTSMATPHVAGAWTVLKQARPNATVDEILNALTSTGVPVLDSRNGMTKPRIDLDDALFALVPPQLVVNTTNDVGDGVCDGTHCSLRDAIDDANDTPGFREIIAFDIGGGGQQTILLDGANGPLPVISDPVVIDGTTQPGYSGAPLIELDGTNIDEVLDPTEVGLNIWAGNSAVRGLVINSFGYGGIGLAFVGNNVISGNYVGTEPDGVTAAPNLYGVIVCSSDDNLIGGTTSADRNIISGNNDDGINICQLPGEAVATDNTVQGNYIGLDVTGTVRVGNGDDGIKIEDATNTLIGGALPEVGNVISGNINGGVTIIGPVATGHIIQGNIIGPNAAGTQGNVGNTRGIHFLNSSGNTIGGTITAARNVISGNVRGILLQGHPTFGGSHNNIIQGNFIGTDISGTAPLPNQNQFGIELGEIGATYVTNTLVGGTTAGAGNVISGNQGLGLFVRGNSNTIQGNFIGTDLSGTLDLGNGVASGVTLEGDNNLVGGTAVGAGNIIAYNTGFGVIVENEDVGDFTATGNAILGNGIFGTKIHATPGFDGLGIDLNISGSVSNDEDDVDTGNNNLQNHPVVTSAEATVNTLTVNGTLNSTPNSSFRVELFLNTTCDPSGYGEGEFFLTGIDGVTTDGSGDAAFSVTLSETVSAGQQLTATATDAANNTSEFSACEPVAKDPNLLVVNTISTTFDNICNSHCSLRDAINIANATGGTQTIQFLIGGGGLQTISPTNSRMWADVTDTVIIDGTTQPGYAGAPLIELDGVNTTSTNGLSIFADNSVIRGLAVNNFRQNGIEVRGTSITIESNYLGLAPDGVTDRGNTLSGVALTLGNNNTVGGATVDKRNVISGNDQHGIHIYDDVTVQNNIIVGNFIGTNFNGTAALGNGQSGIFVVRGGHIIGGLTAGERNLISGNTDDGITLSGSYAANGMVRGNFIGTDVTGSAGIPNGRHGVQITIGADNNIVGGGAAGAGNLISGNNQAGVYVYNSDDNVIESNKIGTDVNGTSALPNATHGVELRSDSDSNDVDSNLISGNSDSGVSVQDAAAVANQILGNIIGGDNSGLSVISNGNHGVAIVTSPTTNVSGNYIVGNIGSGVYLDNATQTTIQSNFIGVAADGITDLGNGSHGIEIANSASNTVIGDPDNRILFNGGDGIFIASGSGNWVRSNQIASNQGLGIDLAPDGVTANDSGDGDTGANLRQNFPVISQVELTLIDITVGGALNSAANTLYRLEFFWSETCDPSGYGEGGNFLGTTDVTTDGSGDAVFSFVGGNIPSNSFITATATDPNGNTSEFSACVEAILYVAMPSSFAVSNVTEIDIELTWTDESIDETHWLLERSLAGENDWTEIANIATSNQAGWGVGESFDDTDFLCSQSYDYRLRGFNDPGDYYSLYTPVVTAAPTCPALVAPGSFAATAISRSQIDLSWTDTNTTETAYVIEHSADGGLNWDTLVALPPDTLAYSHTGLPCLTTHDYRMRTVRDHAGPFSAYTAVEAATTDPCPALGEPINPAAAALSRNRVQFSWSESAPDEVTRYHIERSGDGTVFGEIAIVPGNVTSIVDTNLSCGQTYYYRVRSTRAEDSSFSPYSSPVVNTTTNACPAPVEHTVGLYREGVWQFWDVNENTAPAATFTFGPRQRGWLPVVGDWDGDGTDGIGLYKDGVWVVRNATSAGPIDRNFTFGSREPGWQPVVGDWDGDGTDGIGLYKDGVFQLRQTASSGPPQMTFTFGQRVSGWQPVAGDWNVSGNDSIGLYKDGLWLLSNSFPARSDVAPFMFGQSQPGWKALVGDWNNDGTMTIGVYKDRLWQLRNSNTNGSPHIGYRFPSGQGDWLPLASYHGGLGSLSILAMDIVQPTAEPVLPTASATATLEVTPELTAEVTAEATVEVTAEVTEEVIDPTATTNATATPTLLPTAEQTATATMTGAPPTTTPSLSPTATATRAATVTSEAAETTDEPPTG